MQTRVSPQWRAKGWRGPRVIVIETLQVLSADAALATLGLAIGVKLGFAWAINTNHAKNHAVPALVAGPAPAAQACVVLAYTTGILTDLAKGHDGSTSVLETGAHPSVLVVSCVNLACFVVWFEDSLGNVDEALLSRHDVPLDAALLEHGKGDLVSPHGGEELMIFGVVVRD